MEKKKVLVAVATKKEVALLCEEMNKHYVAEDTHEKQLRRYVSDKLAVEILQVGIGHVPAALACNEYFHRSGLPDVVVNAGYCTAADSFPVGSVVHPGCIMKYDSNLPDYFEHQSQIVQIWGDRYQIMQSMNYVPEINGNNAFILQLCDMESYGIALACKLHKVKLALYKQVASVQEVMRLHSLLLNEVPDKRFTEFPEWLRTVVSRRMK
ncbi:MAG: hypothetical protein LBM06_09795 [Prevotellaceae bacterium]|jgi:nucleoside phosphorylase|nr:hypothetical protein [Prevotellaceae bacterium]